MICIIQPRRTDSRIPPVLGSFTKKLRQQVHIPSISKPQIRVSIDMGYVEGWHKYPVVDGRPPEREDFSMVLSYEAWSPSL